MLYRWILLLFFTLFFLNISLLQHIRIYVEFFCISLILLALAIAIIIPFILMYKSSQTHCSVLQRVFCVFEEFRL